MMLGNITLPYLSASDMFALSEDSDGKGEMYVIGCCCCFCFCCCCRRRRRCCCVRKISLSQ